MTDTEKILNASEFMLKKQGYIDVPLVARMSGIPGMIVANVLENNGYKESFRKDQYIKPLKT